MELESWNTFFQVVSGIALGLTFFAGIGAIWTGYMVSARQSERIATAEARAAEATEATARLDLDAAAARERAAIAELQLLELQKRLADRHLSTPQRAALIAVLREIPGEIRVACAADRPEPCAFAQEIVAALKDAGWTVTDFNRNAIFVGGSSSAGLAIHVNSADHVPKRAGVLQHAFKAAGFEAIAQTSNDIPEDAVALLVKHKM